MRATPMALFISNLDSKEDMYKAVVFDVSITHPSKVVQTAVFIYCYTVQFLIRNSNTKSMAVKAYKEAKQLKLDCLDS